MYAVTNFVVLVSQRQFFTQVDNKVIQYNTIQVAIDTILTWIRKHDIVCVYVCENIK